MNIIRIRNVGLVLLACLAVSLPALAQSTSERLQLIEQRLARLERIVDNNDSTQNMLRRIQELQTENQELRNEVETLQFQTTQSADSQRQLYMDIDQRLQALESGRAAPGGLAGNAPPGVPATGATDSANGGVVAGSAVAGAAAGVASGAPAAPAVSDMDAYAASFDLLKQGRYSEAATGFKRFLEVYPASELRDNAQYWLAETYYVGEDFSTALAEFQKVINNYPSSRKIPDAWLKVGYCNYELKNWENARQALTTAETRFPESAAARLATQRLALMSSEGH